MLILPQHRPQAADLQEQPLKGGIARPQLPAQQLAAFFRQIEQDGAGLEDAQRRAAVGRHVVEDSWNFVIRRNRQKLRMKLLPFANIDPN
ncbi:hypothetical protein SB00610_03904 [Klebsiella quasipneumoniae subsp. similipneumoniae]|nr:hypothetical protein SB00610_03904 [Klebsiella quasipneumoniae subsp. similipneumoniae]